MTHGPTARGYPICRSKEVGRLPGSIASLHELLGLARDARDSKQPRSFEPSGARRPQWRERLEPEAVDNGPRAAGIIHRRN